MTGMYLNKNRPNPFHASEDTGTTSPWVDQSHPMPARPLNVSQMFWPNTSYAGEYIKCISTRDDQTHPMQARTQKSITTFVDQTHLKAARTQNAYQHVLTKLIKCKQGDKMHLNVYWPSSSNASERNKCILSCVDHTPSLLAKTQNAYQHVLTKSIPYQ